MMGLRKRAVGAIRRGVTEAWRRACRCGGIAEVVVEIVPKALSGYDEGSGGCAEGGGGCAKGAWRLCRR